MYERGSDGGLTASELDGVLAQFEKNQKYAVDSSVTDTSFSRFERGIAAGYRMAVEHICSVVGWQCSHNPSFLPHRTAIDCDLPALFVDADGNRWCNDHIPDGELTIAEHDDARDGVDK